MPQLGKDVKWQMYSDTPRELPEGEANSWCHILQHELASCLALTGGAVGCGLLSVIDIVGRVHLSGGHLESAIELH